jgi:hypothetical protein
MLHQLSDPLGISNSTSAPRSDAIIHLILPSPWRLRHNQFSSVQKLTRQNARILGKAKKKTSTRCKSDLTCGNNSPDIYTVTPLHLLTVASRPHALFNERVAEDIQRLGYPIRRPFFTMLRHTELFRIYGVRLPLVVTE